MKIKNRSPSLCKGTLEYIGLIEKTAHDTLTVTVCGLRLLTI